jgi:cytoskeletal protein RodZ
MIRSEGVLKTSYIAIAVIVIIVIAAIAIYFTTIPKPTPTPTTPTPISPTPTPTTPVSPTPTTPTPTTSPPPPGLISFRVTTSTPGSGTQKMMLEMTMILKREMPKYDFLALQFPVI